jgi:flagellar motility protein MotE (MotC chaperone)
MKKLIVILVVIICLTVSIWMIDAMGLIDLKGAILNTLADVSVFSHHVEIYRLGQKRAEEIDQIKAGMEQQTRLLVAEKEQYLLIQVELEKEWKRIEKEVDQLNQEWKRLASERAVLESIKEKENAVKELLSVIELMKPKEIAAMAEELDDALLIKILFSIDERVASQVMAGIDPARAANLTAIIAREGR